MFLSGLIFHSTFLNRCSLSWVPIILCQCTPQPLLKTCLEVICCVPVKAFVQVPASAGEAGEQVFGKAQRNRGNWKSCLAGSYKEQLAPTTAQIQLFLSSPYAFVTYGLQGGSLSQGQFHFYQILSENLCLRMPLCPQYKSGLRVLACTLIMKGNHFLLRQKHVPQQLSVHKDRKQFFQKRSTLSLF